MAESGRLDELQRKFEENPRRYFAPLANEYRKGGDAERAIELCRTYLPHLPGHMSGYIVYGQSLFDANRGQESAHVFQEALRIDPENVIALRHLGDIARMKGERSLAIQWYQKVLDLDPKNEEISAYVAELAVADTENPAPVQQQYAPYEYTTDSVFKESAPSPETEPVVPFVTETLANLYMDQGLYTEALTVYRQLAETRDEPAIHDRVRELEALVLNTPRTADASPHEHEDEEMVESDAIFGLDPFADTTIKEADSVVPVAPPAPRMQPAVTVRDFFAAIGARRLPPDPNDVASHSLTHLFPTAQADEGDVRAAQSLADAYTYGNEFTFDAQTSEDSYARPV